MQCCRESKGTFSSPLYPTPPHGTTEAFCAFDPLFAASLFTALNSRRTQRQYLNFLHNFLRDWAPHNFRSLRMMTLFISSSPRMTETFASLGPDCLFFCDRIMNEYFLWSLVPFLFRSFWGLFLSRKPVKRAADPFGKCLCFVGCSCFLTKLSGTGLRDGSRKGDDIRHIFSIPTVQQPERAAYYSDPSRVQV